MYPDNRKIVEWSFSTIKKYVIVVLYVITVILLFVKWFKFWGMEFSLLGIHDVNGGDDSTYLVIGQIFAALLCGYSLVRTLWRGRDFERAIGFTAAGIFTIIVMIIAHKENAGWGSLGLQLTAAPTVVLILSIIGAVFSLVRDDFSALGLKTAADVIPPRFGRRADGNTVYCSCGAALGKDDDFCWKCGRKRPEIPRCTCCGIPLERDTAFCPRCGTPVSGTGHSDPGPDPADTTMKCPKCGRTVERGSAFCSFCGHRFTSPGPDSTGGTGTGGTGTGGTGTGVDQKLWGTLGRPSDDDL